MKKYSEEEIFIKFILFILLIYDHDSTENAIESFRTLNLR